MSDINRPIKWARDVLGKPGQETHLSWLQNVMYPTLVRASLTLPQVDKAVLETPYALAEVNHNRWIAKCPFCPGAEGVWADDDWFYCCSCGNEAINGQRIKIVFSSPPVEVESLLHARPLIHSRNWLPSETLADLRAENDLHGVGSAG